MPRTLHHLLHYPYSLRFLVVNKVRKILRGYSRMQYFYCIDEAAKLAKKLSIPRISVVEFGVASGNGLLEIERICARLTKTHGIGFDIFGFDTAEGLPEPVDHRDRPYLWNRGFFAMDQDTLRERLTSARLVIGDVKDTIPRFFEDHKPAPIGAIMFDLDYYSSTQSALQIFDFGAVESYLPRIPCYFDDLRTIQSAGAHLAIREFNQSNDTRKIENPGNLAYHPNPDLKGWRIYEYHDFKHPQYLTRMKEDDQIPLA